MKNNKKGFTLAELLIVVAIIAVLVAIAIPVFTSQLEKAKEATDQANIRAIYAELMADALTNGATTTDKTYAQTQTVSGWASAPTWPNNLTVSDPKQNTGTWTFAYTTTNGVVTGVSATN